MRDLDDEFDSSDVVRYVPRQVAADESTQPVSASMIYATPAFDDSKLEAVLSALTDEVRTDDAVV